MLSRPCPLSILLIAAIVAILGGSTNTVSAAEDNCCKIFFGSCPSGYENSGNYNSDTICCKAGEGIHISGDLPTCPGGDNPDAPIATQKPLFSISTGQGIGSDTHDDTHDDDDDDDDDDDTKGDDCFDCDKDFTLFGSTAAGIDGATTVLVVGISSLIASAAMALN